MKVKANQNASESKWLTVGKEYVVIGLDDEHFRVIDDIAEPILFECSWFDIVDEHVPEDWVWRWYYVDGEEYFYADPFGLHLRGFYADYFDDKEYSVRRFQEYLDKIGVNIQAKSLY